MTLHANSTLLEQCICYHADRWFAAHGCGKASQYLMNIIMSRATRKISTIQVATFYNNEKAVVPRVVNLHVVPLYKLTEMLKLIINVQTVKSEAFDIFDYDRLTKMSSLASRIFDPKVLRCVLEFM
jgi:hypothetical protein